ncbi:MAG: response regulator [Ignavibacteriaceae bacterium]|nr:response regulator [Ignavibacteriaceae bacterium]
MIDSTLKTANILIVDDQQANIDVLTGLLDVKGFTNYTTTKDSRQVISLFEKFKPDLLLLDLSMPYFTGFQVMTQLKDIIPASTYFPILVLTADITPESKQKALTGGASDFLTKPFDLIEVDTRIKNLLKTRYLHQQLENQNQILEEKVMERTKELVKTNIELIAAKEQAEKMNRLKSNFLANMSHELRTPLNGINGFADFLRQDLKDPELKFMAESIFVNGNRLSETLNLIMDLSKLESDKMAFTHKPIDLVNQTVEFISLFKEAAKRKGLYLKSSFSQPSIVLNTDEQVFRSIINNLINNAIKFTNKGGVTADISLKDNFVEIKVADSGIGISKEYYGTIFEELRQVSEGYNRNFEGSGLGLNITKKLVEKLGGEIAIDSEPGKGSTFTVRLPVTITGEKAEGKKVIDRAAPNVLTEQKPVRPVALLVDDDPFIYQVLRRYLAGQIDLESTAEGDLAVILCAKKHYDYIFMDINLNKGMDGKQTTEVIRKIKGYEGIPIIATTAYTMAGDKEEFLSAGCSHYLSKPFKQQDVLNLLENILSVKETAY